MDLSSWKPALIVFAFLLVLPLTCSIHIIVEKCPVTETAWKARAQNVTCEFPLKYHCIQNKAKKLMETCMVAYKVKPSREGGCPWALYSADRGSILGVVFHSCKGSGCPQKNDSNYWTNRLYKYPICLHHYNEAITDDTDSTDITEASNNKNETYGVMIAVVTTAVVIIMVFIAAVLAWKYRRRLNSSVPVDNENHTTTSPLIYTAPVPADVESPTSLSPLNDTGENTELTQIQEFYKDNRFPWELPQDQDFAKLHIKDSKGSAPIHLARSVELLQYLIDNDCDVDSKDNTCQTIVYNACHKGHVNLVKHLLDKDKDILNIKDKFGLTPFHHAGFSGSVDLVQYLIDNGCDVYSKDNDGRTIVHIACHIGHENLVKHLIDKDKGILHIKDKVGLAPFHHAGLSGSVGLVQYLIDNDCDVHSEDNGGRTIVHYACQKGHVKLVKHLINEDKPSLNIKDNDGFTPFHHAGVSGSVELVQYLIKKGCDVYSKDNYGQTIVHTACRKGLVKLVRHLISKDQALLDIEDYNGLTPFHCAKYSKSEELVQCLIDNGCV